MSARAGQWSDDEIEEMLDGEHEGGNTDLVKNLRAALRAKSKEVNQFREELGKATKVTRQTTIENLLKARELDPKVAALIPSEVEATEESLGKWLEAYGDLFGAKPPVQQQEGVSDADMAAMRQMDVLAGSASPAANNDMLKSLQSADSYEAVVALINSAGGQV